MKKLIFAAFALGSIIAVSAQESKGPIAMVQVENNGASQSIDVTQDFVEVKLEKLPEAVTAAVAKDFKEFKLVKAYVNPQGQYKLMLASAADGKKTKTVYADSKGNWIKKENNRK